MIGDGCRILFRNRFFANFAINFANLRLELFLTTKFAKFIAKFAEGILVYRGSSY